MYPDIMVFVVFSSLSRNHVLEGETHSDTKLLAILGSLDSVPACRLSWSFLANWVKDTLPVSPPKL